MVKTEGMLNTRTGEYDFIGRSIPIFPQNDFDVPISPKNMFRPYMEKKNEGHAC